MTTSSLTHIYHNHLQVNILETTTHRIESPGSLVLFGGGWVGGVLPRRGTFSCTLLRFH